jgi:hypothetical protein
MIPKKIMNDRFLVPDNIDPNTPTLFAVVDIIAMNRRPLYDTYRFAEAWGVAFKNMQQIFGFRVASIPQMIDAPNQTTLKDFGGYYYYCFKTQTHPTDKLLLTDGRETEDGKIVRIGWGYHGSRYYPYAFKQAMWSAYGECLKVTLEIERREHILHLEVMHPELRREWEFSDHKKYGLPELTEEPYVPLEAKRTSHHSFCCLCDFANNRNACSLAEREAHTEDNLCLYARINGQRVSVIRGGYIKVGDDTFRRRIDGQLAKPERIRERKQLLFREFMGDFYEIVAD